MAMLPLDECRRILRLSESDLPDAALEDILATLTAFAQTFIAELVARERGT